MFAVLLMMKYLLNDTELFDSLKRNTAHSFTKLEEEPFQFKRSS